MIKLTHILNEAENPCWKGYKQVGMKTKNGKEVPNCVPESVEVNEAHYTAVANLGTTKAKENLDSFDELQKFMDKMKSRKAISVQVTKINNGKKQTIDYDWDGKTWVSKNKKGVQESKQLKETMIRRAVDLAQEILPKNTWSRYASNGPKNKEFVKSIVRDLTNLLNRFYKSYDVNVRIKEEIIKEVGSWRIDHYTGKSPGRLTPRNFATVKNDKDREKKRAMERDLAYHLNTFWKKWKVPFRIDLSKTQR